MFKLLTPNRWAAKAIPLTMGILMGAWALPSAATSVHTANSLFNVTVKLTPAPVTVPPANAPTANAPPAIVPPGLPVSAFCTKNNVPTAHGAIVTVVCTTGAVVDIEPGNTGQPLTPMHGGAYRYVTHVTPNGGLIDTLDTFGGAGTVTSWRVVDLTDRNYLEMTLGW